MRFWSRSRRVTVPMVRLSGTIGMGSALRPGISLVAVESALNRAFAIKAPCIALAINSPGGSAAQSSLIARRIRTLAAEKERPVLAFIEDVAASGGYWLASAADEIYADETSIVGSIGVISASFGFTELMEKIGVERRVYTAGENKSILDPFQPAHDKDVEILRSVQADIHEAFVGAVKERRGDKLADDPEIFSGRFWSGRSGVDLGLVDGIGGARAILAERYGKDVRIRQVPGARPSLLRRRLGLAEALGMEGVSAEAAIGAVRSDSLYQRFGL